METTKIYAKRDSAVSYLRKKGVPKEHYNEFLTLTTDQQYKIDTAEVEHFLATSQTPEDVAAAKVGEKVQAEPETKSKKDEKLRVIPPAKKTAEEKAAERKAVTADLEEKAAGRRKTDPTVTVAKEPKRTVSSVCRTLIAEGKTNEEVWETVRLLFDLPDSKKSYPAWYRADMKKKGLIS